jgi:2,3-bisphosphoglycerate-dependent phosphoglycerate mutase
MRLYFVRHGQSENNALYDATGKDDGRNDDPKLTMLGMEQACAVAQYLAGRSDPTDGERFGITHVYCSLMSRAIVTGTQISKAVGLPLTSWKDWHECGGIYLQDKQTQKFLVRPGMTRDQIFMHSPEIQLESDVKADGWWNQPFETSDERAARARKVLRELQVRHGNSSDRVVIVSHGGFYMRFLAAIIGLDDVKAIWFRMNNTAISRFDFEGDQNTLVYHNHLAHLEPRLIS